MYQSPAAGGKTRFVKVKYFHDRLNRTYDYLCDLMNVNVGDMVLVPARGEKKLAQVVECYWRRPDAMPLPFSVYKKVLEKCDCKWSEQTYQRYVKVVFCQSSKEYSYRCEDRNIDVGSFVRVLALGKEETVQVVDTYVTDGESHMPTLREATAAEKEAWLSKYNEDYYRPYDEDDFEDEDEDPGDKYLRQLAEREEEEESFEADTYVQTPPERSSVWTTLAALAGLNHEDELSDEEKRYNELMEYYRLAPSSNPNSLTDDRGYARNGKAEALIRKMAQGDKSVNPYYVQDLVDGYFPSHYDEEEEYIDDDEYERRQEEEDY